MYTSDQQPQEVTCYDGVPLPGAVVRTRRRWVGGVHRALVKEVTMHDGEHWLHGVDWKFPLSEMEVIRNAFDLS